MSSVKALLTTDPGLVGVKGKASAQNNQFLLVLVTERWESLGATAELLLLYFVTLPAAQHPLMLLWNIPLGFFSRAFGRGSERKPHQRQASCYCSLSLFLSFTLVRGTARSILSGTSRSSGRVTRAHLSTFKACWEMCLRSTKDENISYTHTHRRWKRREWEKVAEQSPSRATLPMMMMCCWGGSNSESALLCRLGCPGPDGATVRKATTDQQIITGGLFDDWFRCVGEALLTTQRRNWHCVCVG